MAKSGVAVDTNSQFIACASIVLVIEARGTQARMFAHPTAAAPCNFTTKPCLDGNPNQIADAAGA